MPVLWLLADDSFFDPAFLAGLNWGDMADPEGLLASLTTAGVVLVTLGMPLARPIACRNRQECVDG